MRNRIVTTLLATYLSFAIIGCSKKPAADASTTPADTTTTATNAPAPVAPPADTTPATPPPVRVEKPREMPPMVIPAGTTITVTLGQDLGSKISQAGQTFTATVATPVTVNGRTAIGAGATANGVVVDAKPLGRFAGGASLELKLNSVSIKGVDTAIQTAELTDTAKGKGKRTAVMAGGGAALGALIGGLAGGGKGAAIGAVAGGGAGTGGAAFTGNKNILLPAESSLSFKLEQSVTIRR
jgi:hypothetical protein